MGWAGRVGGLEQVLSWQAGAQYQLNIFRVFCLLVILMAPADSYTVSPSYASLISVNMTRFEVGSLVALLSDQVSDSWLVLYGFSPPSLFHSSVHSCTCTQTRMPSFFGSTRAQLKYGGHVHLLPACWPLKGRISFAFFQRRQF